MAVRKFIDKIALSDPELHKTLADKSLDDLAKKEFLADHLVRTCAFKKDRIDAPDPKTFVQKFYNFADQLYRNGPADGLTALATGCGLASKRGRTAIAMHPPMICFARSCLQTLRSPWRKPRFCIIFTLVTGSSLARLRPRRRFSAICLTKRISKRTGIGLPSI